MIPIGWLRRNTDALILWSYLRSAWKPSVSIGPPGAAAAKAIAASETRRPNLDQQARYSRQTFDLSDKL
jgi:hypothetical protein